MHSMDTKTKKRYWSPTSQTLTLQPVRILDNSTQDYKNGNMDEEPSGFGMPSLDDMLGLPSLPSLF